MTLYASRENRTHQKGFQGAVLLLELLLDLSRATASYDSSPLTLLSRHR